MMRRMHVHAFRYSETERKDSKTDKCCGEDESEKATNRFIDVLFQTRARKHII